MVWHQDSPIFRLGSSAPPWLLFGNVMIFGSFPFRRQTPSYVYLVAVEDQKRISLQLEMIIRDWSIGALDICLKMDVSCRMLWSVISRPFAAEMLLPRSRCSAWRTLSGRQELARLNRKSSSHLDKYKINRGRGYGFVCLYSWKMRGFLDSCQEVPVLDT